MARTIERPARPVHFVPVEYYTLWAKNVGVNLGKVPPLVLKYDHLKQQKCIWRVYHFDFAHDANGQRLSCVLVQYRSTLSTNEVTVQHYI